MFSCGTQVQYRKSPFQLGEINEVVFSSGEARVTSFQLGEGKGLDIPFAGGEGTSRCAL